MKEAGYTAAVKDKLDPARVYAWKVADRYTAGVPDNWYSGRVGAMRDLWVEYKYLPRLPKVIDLTKGKNPMLSKLQQGWLQDRHAEGRAVAVILGSPFGGMVFPALSWQAPIAKETFLREAAQLRYPRDVAGWLERALTE